MRSRRHALRLPEADRVLVLAEPELGIAGEDGHPELVRVDLQVVEDELPGEVDRAFLEVLAEREVAEHLEERRGASVSSPTSSMSGRAEDTSGPS